MLMSEQKKQLAEKIMIALDYSTAEEAEKLLKQLEGYPCYMKVGMQLFYAAGPSFVEKLKNMGYRVFLDVKMHDIPNTVKGGASSITKLGVDMFNVHAAGGLRMMEAAVEGAASVSGSAGGGPTIIAVTQLTSTTVQVMNDEIGIAGTVEDSVKHYAQLASKAGLHGVVASPREVTMIKDAVGSDFITVTPGIRPEWAAAGDQARIMTPADAVAQGTDFLVIGRAVTSADDPAEAMEKILTEMQNG